MTCAYQKDKKCPRGSSSYGKGYSLPYGSFARSAPTRERRTVYALRVHRRSDTSRNNGLTGPTDLSVAASVALAPAILIVMAMIAMIKEVYVMWLNEQERTQKQTIATRSAEYVYVRNVIKKCSQIILIVDLVSFRGAVEWILKLMKSSNLHLLVLEGISGYSVAAAMRTARKQET